MLTVWRLREQKYKFQVSCKVFFFANFSPKTTTEDANPCCKRQLFSRIAQDKYRYSAFVKRTEQP